MGIMRYILLYRDYCICDMSTEQLSSTFLPTVAIRMLLRPPRIPTITFASLPPRPRTHPHEALRET